MNEIRVEKKLLKFENFGHIFPRVFAFLLVVVITIYIYSIRGQAQHLAQYGYGGVFLLSILANATIFLPAPSLLFVFAMGGVFHPLGVAIAAGVGAAVGELSGYVAGYSGQAVIENVNAYQKLCEWMRHNTRLVGPFITLLAFIPIPLIDLAGIAAGALKMSPVKFLLWCMLGKIIKMLLVAYAGSLSIHRVF